LVGVGSLEVLEPVDRDLGVDAEVVVAIEAAIGALDPVQLSVLDGKGRVDRLDVFAASLVTVFVQIPERQRNYIRLVFTETSQDTAMNGAT
jgi:hypothetical protein